MALRRGDVDKRAQRDILGLYYRVQEGGIMGEHRNIMRQRQNTKRIRILELHRARASLE